jgi:hypothetical protein
MEFDKKVIVIDDFYPDPYMMRDMALNAEYEPEGLTPNYPGLNTTRSYWDTTITKMLCKATGETVKPAKPSANGYFRHTREKDIAKQIVHFDPTPGQTWAGVVYLSLPEHYADKDAGTKIVSHKRTGMTIAPKDYTESDAIGVKTFEDMRNFFETEGINTNLWKTELNVDIKFNRAVLFRPWLWHHMGQHFGTDVNNSRLTHLIFLQPG